MQVSGIAAVVLSPLLTVCLKVIGVESSYCPVGLHSFHGFVLLQKKFSEICFLFIVASKYVFQS